MNKETLTPGMMEKAAGGMIVQGEWNEGYFIVNDKNGDVLDRKWHFKDAENSARTHNVGLSVVNKEKYKKYYGKDII